MADSPAQLDIPTLDAARARIPDGLWAVLSVREQGFVAALVANPTMTHRDAAIVAGYPKKSAKQVGYELANRPKVRAALLGVRAEAAAQATRDAQGVITLLWQNAEDARKAKEYAPSNQAAATLAKVYGLLEKRVRLTVDNPEAALAQLKAMPKAERVKVLRELLGVE